jgi:arabinofuranan 3-O-arabinosyltransferase
MDEPLRSLTSAPFAVRDAVPLTPAGTIRLLDEIESRLQTGDALGGATSTLRSAGVRYLVLRNDLAVDQAGQPPVALSRSALVNTPDVEVRQGFREDRARRVGASESSPWRSTPWWATSPPTSRCGTPKAWWGPPEPRRTSPDWPTRALVGARSSSTAIVRVISCPGLGRSPTGSGQGTGGSALHAGRTSRAGLDARRALTASDYLPWPETRWRSLVAYTGIRDVRASTSLAQDFGPAGLQPAPPSVRSSGWHPVDILADGVRPRPDVDGGAGRTG